MIYHRQKIQNIDQIADWMFQAGYYQYAIALAEEAVRKPDCSEIIPNILVKSAMNAGQISTISSIRYIANKDIAFKIVEKLDENGFTELAWTVYINNCFHCV